MSDAKLLYYTKTLLGKWQLLDKREKRLVWIANYMK